jgi:hypothetical protein
MTEVRSGESLPGTELRQKLESMGLYLGQPCAGDPRHTSGLWPRPEGRTFTDLSEYLGEGEGEFPPGQLSMIELHFQINPQAEDFIKEAFFPDLIEKIRGFNPGLMVFAHAPFLAIPPGKPKLLHFDHLLLVPPKALVEEGKVKGFKVEEIQPADLFPLIEALEREGISYLTVHLSSPALAGEKPGEKKYFFLKDEEFQKAQEKVRQLAEYAQAKGVIIGIETGGVTGEQLKILAEMENVQITWDIEHAILDGLTNELAAELLAGGKIGLIHLAVPKEGKHTQSGLDQADAWQKGEIKDLVCLVTQENQKRIRESKAPIPIMLESLPDLSNYIAMGNLLEGL